LGCRRGRPGPPAVVGRMRPRPRYCDPRHFMMAACVLEQRLDD
jgi:hypothetical protein